MSLLSLKPGEIVIIKSGDPDFMEMLTYAPILRTGIIPYIYDENNMLWLLLGTKHTGRLTDRDSSHL